MAKQRNSKPENPEIKEPTIDPDTDDLFTEEEDEDLFLPDHDPNDDI
jgi:hypothetical protein